MLILTRDLYESIHIGRDIKITVMRISRDRVHIGIDAPDDIGIVREEIAPYDPHRRPKKNAS